MSDTSQGPGWWPASDGKSRLPQIDRLILATVTTVPEWHPQHDTFEPSPAHAWLIRHPDGGILMDTGVGVGNEVIDEWYHPRRTSLLDALAGVGVAPSDISAVVMSHPHFDHCGQQGALAAPVYVQATEFKAAQTPGYTVPDRLKPHLISLGTLVPEDCPCGAERPPSRR